MSSCSGEVDGGGKNQHQLSCVRCKSKILPPATGTFTEGDAFELACMVKEKVGEVEKVEQFFRVESMFDFDNLGFTHTVDNFKYLSCADCDLGPIGYHDLTTKISFLAVSRVACNQ